MTKFEQIGAELQQDAMNYKEAALLPAWFSHGLRALRNPSSAPNQDRGTGHHVQTLRAQAAAQGFSGKQRIIY